MELAVKVYISKTKMSILTDWICTTT